MERSVQTTDVKFPHFTEDSEQKKAAESVIMKRYKSSEVNKQCTVPKEPIIYSNSCIITTSYKCVEKGCTSEYTSRAELNQHNIMVHGVKALDIIQPLQKVTPSRVSRNAGKGPFTCVRCGKIFKSPQIWKIHILNHSFTSKSYKLDKVQNREHENAKPQEKSSNTFRKSHKCNNCCQLFASQQALDKHLEQHIDSRHLNGQEDGRIRPYTNLETISKLHKKGCKLKQEVVQNMKCNYDSSRRRIVKCNKCGAVVAGKQSLKMHFNLFHASSKPSSCNGKQVESLYADALKNPKTFALREKMNFKCQYCKAQFMKKTVLRNHVRRVHWNYDETYSSYTAVPQTKITYATRHKQDQFRNWSYKSSAVSDGEIVKSELSYIEPYEFWSSDEDIDVDKVDRSIQEPSDSKYENVVENPSQVHVIKKQGAKCHIRNDSIVRRFKCKVYGCDAAYAHAGSLWNHTASAHKTKSAFKKQAVAKCKDKILQLKGTKILHICTACNKAFPSLYNLKVHKGSKRHARNEKHGETLFTKPVASKRKRSVHVKTTKFWCQKCKTCFKSGENLRTHVTGFHWNIWKEKWHTIKQKSTDARTPKKTKVLSLNPNIDNLNKSANDNLTNKVEQFCKVEYGHDNKENQSTNSVVQNESYVQCAEEAFSFCCELCRAEFKLCCEYIRHVANHSKDVDTCDDIKSSLQKVSTYQYVCGLCGDLFQDRKCLHRHLLVHAAERG